MKVREISLEGDDLKAFIDFSWEVYDNKFSWIPPIKDSLYLELSDSNPFFSHAQKTAFVCEKNGKILGRILVFIDSLRIQNKNQLIGNFGYFEAINDPAVFNLIINHSFEWLKKRGVTEVHGPMNLNIFNNYRIQTKGHEKSPFLGEPRSPDYYFKNFNELGFNVFQRWNSWDLTTDHLDLLYQMTSQTIENDCELKLKIVDLSQLEKELYELAPLALDIFSNNYGFSQISSDELVQHFMKLRPILSPGNFIKLYDSQNSCIGFVYAYFDPAQAFIEMNGDIQKFSVLKQVKAERVIFHTFGVHKDFRKGPAAYLLAQAILKHAIDSKLLAIGALAVQGKSIYDKIGVPDRSYAILSKFI